jgi:hypothetical protein
VLERITSCQPLWWACASCSATSGNTGHLGRDRARTCSSGPEPLRAVRSWAGPIRRGPLPPEAGHLPRNSRSVTTHMVAPRTCGTGPHRGSCTGPTVSSTTGRGWDTVVDVSRDIDMDKIR